LELLLEVLPRPCTPRRPPARTESAPLASPGLPDLLSVRPVCPWRRSHRGLLHGTTGFLFRSTSARVAVVRARRRDARVRLGLTERGVRVNRARRRVTVTRGTRHFSNPRPRKIEYEVGPKDTLCPLFKTTRLKRGFHFHYGVNSRFELGSPISEYRKKFGLGLGLGLTQPEPWVELRHPHPSRTRAAALAPAVPCRLLAFLHAHAPACAPARPPLPRAVSTTFVLTCSCPCAHPRGHPCPGRALLTNFILILT
jgi:hypothetical protein